MTIATLTSQNQITIPEPIRKSLGLKPGQKISFNVESSGRVVMDKLPEPESLFGVFKSYNRDQTWNSAEIWTSRWKDENG